MKTNIGIVTSDEERAKIAQSLGGKEKLVSRKALTEAINKYVQELINGKCAEMADNDSVRSSGADPLSVVPVRDDPSPPARISSVLGSFKPSRGDEPYLFKARDPALHERLSRLLDGVEGLEEYVWNKMQENRE